MKNFTLQNIQQIQSREAQITEIKGEATTLGQRKQVMIREQYELVVADLVQQGMYPNVTAKGNSNWNNYKGFGGEAGSFGQAVASAIKAKVTDARVKRLRERSTKLIAMYATDLQKVDASSPKAVIKAVKELFESKGLVNETKIANHVDDQSGEKEIDALVRKVVKLSDADRITFERKLAEALKSKAEAEEAQRKAEAEALDINEVREALLNA
jgi:hypothetical protein